MGWPTDTTTVITHLSARPLNDVQFPPEPLQLAEDILWHAIHKEGLPVGVDQAHPAAGDGHRMSSAMAASGSARCWSTRSVRTLSNVASGKASAVMSPTSYRTPRPRRAASRRPPGRWTGRLPLPRRPGRRAWRVRGLPPRRRSRHRAGAGRYVQCRTGGAADPLDPGQRRQPVKVVAQLLPYIGGRVVYLGERRNEATGGACCLIVSPGYANDAK